MQKASAMLSDSSLFVLRDISLRRCVPAVGKPYIFKCYGHHRDNDWGPSHQDRHFVRSPRILSIELWVPPGSGGVVSESASMQAGITSTATLPPPNQRKLPGRHASLASNDRGTLGSQPCLKESVYMVFWGCCETQL